jgi:hypothetical protein
VQAQDGGGKEAGQFADAFFGCDGVVGSHGGSGKESVPSDLRPATGWLTRYGCCSATPL